MPKLEYGRVVVSPLRNESNASFGIFRAKNGDARYNDLASQDSGDAYDFVGHLFSLPFKDVLIKINQDFNLNFLSEIKSLPRTHGEVIKDSTGPSRKTIIEVIYRGWNDGDRTYWDQFGLTLNQVHNAHIFPIAYYRINNGRLVIADEIAYTIEFYDQGDGVMMRKIYQPYNKEAKWRTNLNTTVVPNIKRLPHEGDLLIITKSIKDALVLERYGYNAISTNSESTFIPHEVFEKLKRRFKSIVLFFDNDDAGKRNSQVLAEKHNIGNIRIPDEWLVKDISDYRKEYGKGLTSNILKVITKH